MIGRQRQTAAQKHQQARAWAQANWAKSQAVGRDQGHLHEAPEKSLHVAKSL